MLELAYDTSYFCQWYKLAKLRRHISKYMLQKILWINTLWKNTLKNKYTFGNTILEIQIVDENFYLQLQSNRHICPHTSIVDENFLSTITEQ